MGNPIVSVQNVSHRYSVQWAVKGVSFEIDAPGVTGLLGSNGAGKSTIMNIICGALVPTEGKVSICGFPMDKKPVEAKANIGFLPQRPPLYGDQTVDEQLEFAAALRGMPKSEIGKALEDVKEKCGIGRFGKRLIRNLSGGYQQRVGIAQAIIHSPRFVVMDEPTNGLDPNQVLEVRKLISDIAEECSVLISTHILSEVQASCSRIIMIEHGSLVFDGSTEDFDNYIEPDTFITALSRPPLTDVLKSIEGVTDAAQISEDGDEFRLWYDGEKQTLSRFVEESVRNGWGLYGLTVEKSSMNEVFAKLSHNAEGK